MYVHAAIAYVWGMVCNIMYTNVHNHRWMGGARVLVGGLQQLISFPKHAADCAMLPVDAPSPPGRASAAAPATPITDALQGLDLRHGSLREGLPGGWVHAGDEPYLMFLCCNLAWLDNDMFRPAAQAGPSTGAWFAVVGYVLVTRCRVHGLVADARCNTRGRAVDAARRGQGGRAPSRGVPPYQGVSRLKPLCTPLYTVQALVFRPMSSGTWLVVDGEVIPFEPVVAEVLPGVCFLLVFVCSQPCLPRVGQISSCSSGGLVMIYFRLRIALIVVCNRDDVDTP